MVYGEFMARVRVRVEICVYGSIVAWVQTCVWGSDLRVGFKSAFRVSRSGTET